jgi:hypothetical protein
MANLEAYLDQTVIKIVKIPYITRGDVSSVSTLQATDAIGVTHEVARIKGSGNVTLTSTPSINAGEYDGQRLIIHGTDDSNTVTLQDESNLGSSGVRLTHAYNCTFGVNDTMELIWYDAGSVWVELGRSDSY